MRIGSAADRAFAPPDTPPQYARERTFQELHLRLDLAIDEDARTVSGTATHRLAPINKGLREIVFDQENLHVRGVRDESGQALDWETHGETLVVRLPKARNAGEPFEIRVRYSCSPRKGLFFTAPDKDYPNTPRTVWTQGEEMDNRSWYPSYDYPNEKFTTEIVATVKEKYKAIANGRLVSEKHDAGKGTRTFHWLQDKPHPNYLVGLVVGEWDSKDWNADGIPVQAYVPKGYGKYIDLCFSRVPEMLRFFGRATGLTFPWDKYAQACVPEFIFGAMENTTITILHDDCLTDERAYPDYNPDTTLSHELVHHWFGNWITCKSWGHVWLKEAFANYFECLWWEEHYGKDEFLVHLEEMRAHYFEEAETQYRRPIVIHEFVDAKEMFDAHTYDKGAAVLHMLRSRLGDDLWWKGIRAYVAAHGKAAVETDDFKVAMEEATGKSLDGFFEQWLHKPGHPEYEVSWSWDAKAKRVEVRVKQTQDLTSGAPLFKTPATLEFATEDRVWRETIQLEKAEHLFHFPSRERPKAVVFDPEGVLLKRLIFRRGIEELLWILSRAEGIWPRIEACSGLGRSVEDDRVAPALEETLRRDSSWAVRRAAAMALGELGTRAARDALLRSMDEEDSRVRCAIYRTLGRFRKDDLAFKALARAYREDGKYYPMAAAGAALGETRHPAAFEAIVQGMDRSSHAEVISSEAARGLVALRDERGIDALIERTRYGEPEMRRYAAAIALGKMGRLLEARRHDVLDHLVGLTKDRNARTKLGAIEGLGELGSPQALPPLEKIYEGEVLWSYKRRARRALRKIREAQAEGARLREQQSALDSLHGEGRDLRRRLAALEARVNALDKTRR
jgi:aminopeptidase N